MGVRPFLPVERVEVILGNNLAGESVLPDLSPSPIVTPSPLSEPVSEDLAEVQSYVVTRFKAKMVIGENKCNLHDTRVPV